MWNSALFSYRLVDLCGAKTPATLKQFAVIFQAAGLPDITTETVPFSRLKLPTSHSDYDPKYCVPSFEELGKRALINIFWPSSTVRIWLVLFSRMPSWCGCGHDPLPGPLPWPQWIYTSPNSLHRFIGPQNGPLRGEFYMVDVVCSCLYLGKAPCAIFIVSLNGWCRLGRD